jgi:DNA-binding HxlR family transcriptional regulator
MLFDRLASFFAKPEFEWEAIQRRRDPADARRLTYRLTRRDIDLAPVLFEMILWAARHERTAAPPEEVGAMERDRAGYLAAIRQAWADPAE